MQDLWQLHYQTLLIMVHKEFMKITYKNCDCFLEYESVKVDLIKYKRLASKKDYSNKIDEELKEIKEHV